MDVKYKSYQAQKYFEFRDSVHAVTYLSYFCAQFLDKT